LKDCGCINETKKHHLIFKMAVSCSEGRFLFVSFLNTDPIIGFLEIELRVNYCPAETI
jgi:hypothetical protein